MRSLGRFCCLKSFLAWWGLICIKGICCARPVLAAEEEQRPLCRVDQGAKNEIQTVSLQKTVINITEVNPLLCCILTGSELLLIGPGWCQHQAVCWLLPVPLRLVNVFSQQSLCCLSKYLSSFQVWRVPLRVLSAKLTLGKILFRWTFDIGTCPVSSLDFGTCPLPSILLCPTYLCP